jgi:D-alanyl-D-alanine dipeptidase
MTITRDDVEDAAGWLSGQVVRTPVVRVASLDRVAGARIWLKAENLQTSGAYKARGALRAVGQVATESCTGGVIAQSTGNHALAVAMAAVDDTPEASQNACFTAARNLPWVARRNRQILIGALASVGMVNYPTEWWHWSYGDRYWAFMSRAEHARYEPLDVPGAA